MKMKKFNFLFKIATTFDHKKYHENIIIFRAFLYWILKLFFTCYQILYIWVLEKIPGVSIFFSVNQLENNHTLMVFVTTR